MKSKTLEKKFFFFPLFENEMGEKKRNVTSGINFVIALPKTIKNHVNSQAAIERLSDNQIP